MKTTDELRLEAAGLAQAIAAVADGTEELGTALDRNQKLARKIPDELRDRIIAFRTELYARGFHDPVLARFDSATVTQPQSASVAQVLEVISEKL